MSTLYFYCSNQVFTNIIRQKEIWLSDMNYSNDYAEIIGFAKPLIDIFKECIIECKDTLKEAGYSSEECMQKIIKVYESQVNNKLRTLYCLAICFSRRRDDLSQWRAYGSEGKGFAIGFNEEALIKTANSHKLLNFKEICYDKSTKIQHIAAYTKKIIHEIQAFIVENKGDSDLFSMKGTFSHFISPKLDDILKYAPFYKNGDFRAEDEVRLAYVRTIFAKQFYDLEANSFLNKIDCRVSEDKIIPYLALPLINDTKLFDEIIIGPCNGTTLETLHVFLARHGIMAKHVLESAVSFRIK